MYVLKEYIIRICINIPSSALYNGTRYRVLNNVIDEGVREALDVDVSLLEAGVGQSSEQLKAQRGLPKNDPCAFWSRNDIATVC